VLNEEARSGIFSTFRLLGLLQKLKRQDGLLASRMSHKFIQSGKVELVADRGCSCNDTRGKTRVANTQCMT
jgi:hypothetical protein